MSPRMAEIGNCSVCRRPIRDGVGCVGPEPGPNKVVQGRVVRRAARPKGDIFELSNYCPDCGAAIGQFHHLGCDLEACPLCQGQLYFCDCHRPGVELHAAMIDLGDSV
jgi:hypothetical protein